MNRARITLVACAVLVLAGCAGEPADVSSTPPLSPPASAPPSAPGPFGTHHVDVSDGVPEAQIAGTLVLVDGCLIVEDSWEYANPVALPDVAVWDEQAQAVTIDGVTYALGDVVAWGGGYHSDREEVNLPATCPTDDEIAIVYTTS